MTTISDRLEYLVLDFETAGLDERLHAIIDVGVIGTTIDHRTLFRYSTLVHATQDTIDAIRAQPYVLNMMTANGLLDRLIAGSENNSLPRLRDVEKDLVRLIEAHGEPGRRITLSGSGVGTFDMRFIRAHLPILLGKLNYYVNDVGGLRREWNTATGGDLVSINNDKPHTGLDDALIHLAEAQAYRSVFTKLARAAGGTDLATILAFLEDTNASRERAAAETSAVA